MSVRPEVKADLSNVDEVCDYYGNHGPNARFLKTFHVVMDKLCVAPEVVMAPGVPEAISDHLASGNPTILAMTHHSWFDPVNAAAAINEQKSLRPIRGNTIIPANLDYFNKFFFGPFITFGGAKPAYREKDLAHYYAKQGLSETEVEKKLADIEEDRKAANKQLYQTIEETHPDHIYASFVEGTRNRGDQSKVQPVKQGVKHHLKNLDHPEKAKIICMGFDYGGGRILKRYLTPTVFVDFIDAPHPDEVIDRLGQELQTCIDGAIAHRTPELRLSPLAKLGLTALVYGAYKQVSKQQSESKTETVT